MGLFAHTRTKNPEPRLGQRDIGTVDPTYNPMGQRIQV